MGSNSLDYFSLIVVILVITVVLSGCVGAGRYKNPNTNTIFTIKLNDALEKLISKNAYYFEQEWIIHASESCSREEGYGKVVVFSDWYPRKTEEKTSLQPDKRVYIEATIVEEPKVEPIRIHCSGVISFIPNKNTEYVIDDKSSDESYCKIEVKDAVTNKVPVSFLTHKDCGDHLCF